VVAWVVAVLLVTVAVMLVAGAVSVSAHSSPRVEVASTPWDAVAA